MQPDKVGLNGFIMPEKQNYLWSGALTLAWQQLEKSIIKEQIQIETEDQEALKIVRNFNNSPFSTKDLSEDSYYVCAGVGSETIKKINKEVNKKFPLKTIAPLKADISDNGIIAYAYFFKQLQFLHPFKKGKMTFNGKRVSGFMGESEDQKKQVHVHSYENEDNFLISLQNSSPSDSILILKTQTTYTPQEVLNVIKQLKVPIPLSKKDVFKMPCVELKCERHVEELQGKTIKNNGHPIQQIYEIIKLNIDEKGVLLENEGVIKSKGCMKILPQKRVIILDKPFWIAMRQSNKHPYFLAYINDLR